MEGVSLQKYKAEKYEFSKQNSVGKDLHIVTKDRLVKTDPSENKNRRTLILRKQNNSWGFTLQTYGVHHKKRNELELMTYVDYVELRGAAHLAGMRAGDVILSVNGVDMTLTDHDDLVAFIRRKCDKTMRMVVLFEDCCRKVSLHTKCIKLKTVLKEKISEYRSLKEHERRLLKGYHTVKSHDRESVCSTASTLTEGAVSDTDATSRCFSSGIQFTVSPTCAEAKDDDSSVFEYNDTLDDAVSYGSTEPLRHCQSTSCVGDLQTYSPGPRRTQGGMRQCHSVSVLPDPGAFTLMPISKHPDHGGDTNGGSTLATPGGDSEAGLRADGDEYEDTRL